MPAPLQYKEGFPEHCLWLSQIPQFYGVEGISLWKDNIVGADFDSRYEAAKAEGSLFETQYLEDVQFVVSRTNHHHHKLNSKGEMVHGRLVCVYIYIYIYARICFRNITSFN